LPCAGVDVAGQHFLRGIQRVAPADHRNLARFHAVLVKHALDAAGHQIAQANDGVDLLLVARQVVGHAVDDFRLVQRVVGHFPGNAQRLEHAGSTLFFLHAVGGTRNFHRHPHEVPGLHQLVVHQVLRPAAAEHHQIAAHIGVEADLGVRRVEVDDGDVRLVRFLGDFHQAARIGRGGGDAVGMGRDGGAHGFLLRGHVAIMERGIDRVAGVLGPLLGPGQEVGPHRIGRRTMRDPVECLGVGGL
jgi:hypothetical protein